MTEVGRAVAHESAYGHVTGAALYTDDLAARFSGLLHAWPVCAPHAHALVTAIDAGAAARLPGVVRVLTAGDVPGEGDTGSNRHDEPLFPNEVRFHGQPVAWVVGETLTAAKAGAQAVAVTYAPRPAILTIAEAIAAGSFLTGQLRLADGDLAALAAAPVRIAGELSIGGQEHFYLETQSAIAAPDESGGVFVYSSTQHPTETQEIVARVLGLAHRDVTVECLRMGGAFGGKEVQANTWAAIAALAAWTTRRPVRVRLPRQLDMALTGKRHPFFARYDAGFTDDGRLQGVRIELFADGGWSLDLSEPVLWRALFHCDNAYRLPAVEAIGRVCRTDKTSQTAFRGFGGPQGMLVIEEVMAHAARRLSLPAETVRARNLYKPGDATHYGQPVIGAERLQHIWRRVQDSSGFAARRTEIAQFNDRHRHCRRGLAVTPVKFGISFTAAFFNQAGALVLLYRDGTAQVSQGGTEMGQGLFTKIQQIAADGLGVTRDRVRVMPTRTDKVPNTSATAASAGTDLNGAAVADACRQIRARLAAVAADVWGCDPAIVRFADDAVSDGAAAMTLGELCEIAYKRRVPLFAHGYYRTPDIHFDPATGKGQPFYYYTFGAAVSEVEVDGFTGALRLVRTDILQDLGDPISPVVDRGQIEGGFAQGVGWLTLEDLRWDGDGKLATGSASTYKLPSLSDVPETLVVDFLDHATQTGVIAGSKAIGEPPLMLAISVREAIRDAVAAFGDGGWVTFASPAIGEHVFFAIERARASAAVPR